MRLHRLKSLRMATLRDAPEVAAAAAGGFSLASYNPDGSLNGNFGNNGLVLTTPGNSTNSWALALAADRATGKLVAAGIMSDVKERIALARYNADGSLDANFGGTGIVLTEFQFASEAHALAVNWATGRLVVAGIAVVGGTEQFALVGYNPDGSMDATFGNGGRVTTGFPVGPNGNASAVATSLAADWATGKLVAAGTALGGAQFGLARYNPDGSLDVNFGNGGLVTTAFPNNGGAWVNALAADPTTGKLVAAGYAEFPGAAQFALARFNPDGGLDGTFGNGGRVLTTFPGTTMAVANALAVDWATGNLVAAGYASDNPGFQSEFALARYNPDGTLDGTFGNGGRVLTSFAGGRVPWASAWALTPDWATGKLTAAGNALVGNTNQFGLARYNPDGSLDANFGNRGQVTTSFPGTGFAAAFALAANPATGLLVAAGTAQ
jgi:uncharacterized delta-60 repeat protein